MATIVAPQLALPKPSRWNRPLLGLAVVMALTSLVALVLAVADPREVLGQNAWFKPLKFSLSIAIYAVTMAWLVGLPGLRRPRIASAAAFVTVVALVIEMVVIVRAAAIGTTSHFNVATTLSTTLWSLMGFSIAVVWVMTLVVGLLVLVRPLPDAARTLAIRAGVVLGLIGMGLALLMVTPTAEQQQDFQGIAGAHAVGVADGGAGLPFLGWSTEGGDLRIPHFVGLHALQVVPLTLLALELLARRIPALRRERTRFRLVVVAVLGYAALVTLLTVQALVGQPITRPSGSVVGAGALLAVGVLAGGVVALKRRNLGPVPAVSS
jgi:hypothetical protein